MLPDLATGTAPAARILRSVRVESPRGIALLDREDAPVIDQAALDAAYERGRADAEAEFRASAQAAESRAAAALELLANRLAAEQRAAVGATTRAVVAAAVDVAEWVLRQPLDARAHGLVTRLTDAAQALIPAPGATVRVAETDAAVVRRWAANHGFDVVEDATLSPGDAMLDTPHGYADVSVAAALRVAAEMLGVDPGRYPA